MTKPFDFALLVLILAACDSGSSVTDSPDALVGTWLLEATTPHSYVTASETRTAMDTSQPGTGGIAIRGAQPETLRYVTGRTGLRPGEDPTVSLSTFPSGQDYPSGPWMTLYLTRSYAYLTVGEGPTQTQHYTYYSQSPSPVTLSRTAVELAPISFEFWDPVTESSKTLQASGALTFATRQYTTSVETEVQPLHSMYTQEHLQYRFVFEADGTFRSETTEGSRTSSRTGRWEASNGRLRASLSNITTETITTEYRYSLDGGVLSLAFEPTACAGYCVQYRETLLYLDPGTLASVRDEVVYRYTPSVSLGLPEQVEQAPDTPALLQRVLTPGLTEPILERTAE